MPLMWMLLAPLLLALWALLASPAIALAGWMLHRLRRRGDRRPVWPPLLAAVFTALAAPMPTPIITLFVPHGLMLLQGRYYPEFAGQPEMLARMWPWVWGSLALTFIVTWALFHHLLRRPSPRPASGHRPWRWPLRGSSR